MRPKIYLAGPINGCTDQEASDWRQASIQALHSYECFDPMVRDYRGREDEAVNEIVEYDKADIDQCEFLLVNYAKPSVGTSMEILYAWERHKWIFIVAAPGTPLSPWLRYHSHYIFSSFHAAWRHLEARARVVVS